MRQNERVYGLELAGVRVNLRFRHPEQLPWYRRFLCDAVAGLAPVELDAEDEALMASGYPPEQQGAVAERKMLSVLVSDALIPHGRVIVHGVAFVLDGRCWLLTAPSGTGKSTQYRNLARLYPGKVPILCGDNPVLQFGENEILVHPSPWNGKENWGSMRVAPLAGIVLLEQAASNEIARMAPQEAVVPIFHQMNTFLKSEELVHPFFRMEERLLTSVPLWRFRNTGDEASSRMLYKTIREAGHEL